MPEWMLEFPAGLSPHGLRVSCASFLCKLGALARVYFPQQGREELARGDRGRLPCSRAEFSELRVAVYRGTRKQSARRPARILGGGAG